MTGKPTITRNRLGGTVRLTGLVPDPELGLSSPRTYLEISPTLQLYPCASLSPKLPAQTPSCPQFISVPGQFPSLCLVLTLILSYRLHITQVASNVGPVEVSGCAREAKGSLEFHITLGGIWGLWTPCMASLAGG